MNSLLVLSLASSAAALSTVMRLGCDGGVDFGEKAPLGPLSLRLNGFSKLVSFLDSSIEENSKDATCGCPEISSDNLNKFFKTWSPKFLFNLVKGFEAEKFGPIAACGNAQSMPTNVVPKVDLPSTCTADRWNAGEGCQAAIKRTTGDMKLVLHMEKCAGREVPFFELKCEGKDCDMVLSPCTADNDCADGTDFSCFEFASIADQCAQETCTGDGYANAIMQTVANSKCVKGAYDPVTPTTGCTLNGVKYGVGFSYVFDNKDAQRTKSPKSEDDIQECVKITCQAADKWSTASPASPFECFESLMTREAATGDQCSGAGNVVPNKMWPLTRSNTCNWNEIRDGVEYGLEQAIKPFYVGATRYVSNADELLGGFFGYDAVDYAAEPQGCRKSSDAFSSWIQLARKITDKYANRAERTLVNTGSVGICIPGQGYSLEATSSPTRWTSYSPKAPMEDPAAVLKNNFGLTCSLECVGATTTRASATPSSPSFSSNGQACTSTELAAGAACRASSCSGSNNAQVCACLQAQSQCFAAVSTVWCDDVYQDINNYVSSSLPRFCSGSASSGSSGSSGLEGNCTASCGKDAFVYTGAKYGDSDKFDGASARSVRKVTPITEGATVLAHVNCVASAAVLPNHNVLGFELSASGMLEMLFGVRSEHRNAYKCRATAHGGKALTDDQYDVRSFTLSNVLYFMTKPISTQLTDIGVKFVDLRTRLLSSGAGRLSMPSSCSFDNWIKQGQCRLTFTGLGNAELFAEQTDLNMYLSVCPGSFLPEAYLECVGKGCRAFQGPIGCASDSDCQIAGFRCNKFEDLFAGESNGPSGSISGSSGFPTPVSRAYETYAASISKGDKNAPFNFASTIDLAGSKLRVSTDFPDGITGGVEVQVIKGAYTGKFGSVDFSPVGVAVCDSESIKGSVSYKSDGVYVSSTCTCSLGRRRDTTVNMKVGTQIKNALAKRQEVIESESSSTSIVGSLAGFGVFQTDKQECVKRLQTGMLGRVIALVSGATYSASKDGICFLDQKTRDAQGRSSIETWANDQVLIDGSEIQLKYLKGWKEGSAVQPIDDGKTLQDQFKDADWLEKTGRFCVACPEGVNKDVGSTPGADSAPTVAVAVSAIVASMTVMML